MCQQVNIPSPPNPFPKKYEEQFVPCRIEGIYSIPFSCGGEYIGQTGRCLNDRLREHFREVADPSEETVHPIAAHRRTCGGCKPRFKKTRVLGRHPQRFGREVIESFAIKNSVVNVSSPSLALSDREIDYLSQELSGVIRRPR